MPFACWRGSGSPRSPGGVLVKPERHGATDGDPPGPASPLDGLRQAGAGSGVDGWPAKDRYGRVRPLVPVPAPAGWREQERSGSGDEQAGRIDTLTGARDRLVFRVLEGQPLVDRGEAERVLGVDPEVHTLGLVLWTASDHQARPDHLTHLARKVVRQLAGRATLTVLPSPRQLWVWTGWPERPGPERIRTRLASLDPPPGVHVSAGPVHTGLEGFRRSHELAMAGQRLVDAGLVTPRDPAWLCEHSEVAVLSMFIADIDLARWFTDATLGALNAADPWCATLRETLRTYLALDRSRQGTAKALFISRNTVGYRVAKAIEFLGHPLQDPMNVRLALDVSRMLHSGPVDSTVRRAGAGPQGRTT
jgi:PucR C-terminal helix-turn-helix domain/GGDEF-like domain